MPAQITQTSNDINSKYLSCTYIWGSNPSGAPNTSTQYYSQESFYDSVSNDLFYYTMFCTTLGYVMLARWFPNGTQVYSGEGTIYQWLMGVPQNTCSPFSCTLGTTQGGIPPPSPQFLTLAKT
jgi:hypothetical protein